MVVMPPCSRNNDKQCLHLDTVFCLDYFNPQLVESAGVEHTDSEGSWILLSINIQWNPFSS
jgi:hypothetical protein